MPNEWEFVSVNDEIACRREERYEKKIKKLDSRIKKLDSRIDDLERALRTIRDDSRTVLKLVDNEISELVEGMEENGEWDKLADWDMDDGVGGENGLDPIVFGHKMEVDRLRYIFNSTEFEDLITSVYCADQVLGECKGFTKEFKKGAGNHDESD